MMPPSGPPPEASFNPLSSVPAIPTSPAHEQRLAQAQITRPLRVFTRIVLRCECGLRLVGTEAQFFPDTLYFRGVCLECGTQDLMFVPPCLTNPEGFEQHLALEVDEMAEAIQDLIRRRIGDEPTPVERDDWDAATPMMARTVL